MPGLEEMVERALEPEAQAERADDRAYWQPLKAELETLRHARVNQAHQ